MEFKMGQHDPSLHPPRGEAKKLKRKMDSLRDKEKKKRLNADKNKINEI